MSYKFLNQISLETGLSSEEIIRLSRDAPLRYKHFAIPKKGTGIRKISQPSKAVKIIQRSIIKTFEPYVEVHDCAMAYRKQRSIVDNAARHVGNGPIMKMDFRDFFPSIKLYDWLVFVKARNLTDVNEAHVIGRFLFHKPTKYSSQLCLAIGAPSSPFISNVIMYDFDSILHTQLHSKGITYTRYADDLTFSAKRAGFLHEVMPAVKLAIDTIQFPKLRINTEKTKVITSKYRRIVTGITLTNQGKVSVGLPFRRIVRAAIHRLACVVQDKNFDQVASDIDHEVGKIAFAAMVEPEFFKKMENKYGPDVIERIMKLTGKYKEESSE